jgi:hypothetical protein
MTVPAASWGVRTVAFSCPYIKQQQSLNIVEEESICQGGASALPFPPSQQQSTVIPVNRIDIGNPALWLETDPLVSRLNARRVWNDSPIHINIMREDTIG